MPYAIFNPEKSEYIWSNGLSKFLGIDQSVTPGLDTFLDYVHPQDLPMIRNLYLANQHSYSDLQKNIKYRVKRSGGGYKWVVSTVSVIHPDKGSPCYMTRFYDQNILNDHIAELQNMSLELGGESTEQTANFTFDEGVISKVVELTHIGWYEHFMDENRIVHSQNLKEILGLSSKKSFEFKHLYSKALDEYSKKAKRLFSKVSPTKPKVNLDMRTKVDNRIKWLNLQVEFTFHDGLPIKSFGVVQDVTELKDTQDKLERAQTISNIGWYEYDLVNPENSKCSSEWLRMHDFDDGKVPQLGEYMARLHPYDQKKLGDDLACFLQRMGSRWDKKEFRLLTKNDQVKYISNSSRVLFEGEKPVKVFGVTRDITQGKLAQKALCESERLHRLLSETSRDVIMLLSGEIWNARVAYVSDSVSSLLGYQKAQVLDHKASSFIHPDDLNIYLKTFAMSLSVNGANTKLHLRLVRKNGTSVWVEVIANSFSLKGELMIRLSIRDISEWRDFEEQLIHTNNDLDALIRATDNLIFVIDSDGRFERVIGNEDRFHIPPDEFVGQKVEDVWNDPNGIEMTSMVNRSFAETSSESFNCLHVNRHGGVEWLLVTTYPYMGYDQKARVSVVVEEITRQKQYEQELEKTLEMERELSKMRANFVAMASHQFRTPLTVIKSNMQLLKAVDLYHPVLDRVESRLTREVDRLVNLMEDILLIGKSQTNNMRVERKAFCLRDLVSDLISDIDQITGDDRLLKVTVLGRPVEFIGDYDLLRHALLNIITNAFKYSPEKPNPELKIDYNPQNHIQLTVRDYGIGIPSQDHSRIFNDFYRGNNVGEIPGTGLGMSITREFLKLNDCSIQLESELGLGSVFTVQLPKNTKYHLN